MGGFTQWGRQWWPWRRRRRASVDEAAPARPFDAEFATIFDNAAIGITITDGAGTFVRTNSAFDRFLGYGPGELVGAKVRSVVHADDWAADDALFQRVRDGLSTSYQIEKRYLRKDGSVVWGRLVASRVRRQDGSLLGIGMVEDIDERMRVKAQLDQVNDRLKLYLDHAPLACVVWGPDRIIREWNPAAERMFGYAPEQAIGRDVYELMSTPEGLVVVEEVRAKVLSGGQYPDGVVVENRCKDGSRLRIHWHFAQFGRNTGEEANIAFGIDVTAKLRAEEERERLETHLRQAQKMQSLGTLAGGIAHDFNNILLAISGNTRLAAQDLPSDHPAQVSLGEVAKASSRASSIVNQILAFSRREEPARVSVDLRTILEESVTLMRAALPLRVAIVTRVASSSPIVHGDPAQIHQVLLNLATNAAHAMGEAAGTVYFDLEDVTIAAGVAEPAAALAPGRYLCVSVRDTGTGMDPAILDRIFEPFFTTKPRGQGTGLGLSVVHGIVKAHGGTITVDSTPGGGSTFHVYLPAVKGRASTAQAATAAPRGDGQCILYVDDEEPLVYLITRVLERLGYRVAGYSDACAALEHFLSEPDRYAAVVTDLSMPGLSGADLARRVLRERPDLPVIMTSGYVSAADRDAALRSGVRELLLKPNTVEELGQVLHRLLSEESKPRHQATAAGSKMT